MEMKVHHDTRIVLSFSEDEILKLLTYLEYSDLVADVSKIRYYDNMKLENFIYGLGREIDLLIEDKLKE